VIHDSDNHVRNLAYSFFTAHPLCQVVSCKTLTALLVHAAGKASERCHFVSLPVTLEDAATPVAGQGEKIDENDSALVRFW